jgi:DNA-binding MarR family transcriptional regulator
MRITTALVRLSRQPIGLKEASALFQFADGPKTVSKLATLMGMHKETVKSRVMILRKKGLIQTNEITEGVASYTLTIKGKNIITEVLIP